MSTKPNYAAQIAELQSLLAEQGARITALEDQVIKLSIAAPSTSRNRGPKSEAQMTDIIAWRIRYGDRSTFKVAQNAEFFGLSRGQVYSLDKYTFQHVKENSFNEESPEFVKSVAEFTK